MTIEARPFEDGVLRRASDDVIINSTFDDLARLDKQGAELSRASHAKDDRLVSRVVLQLNALCKRATFDFAIGVGKLIIDSFYSGRLDAWRNHGAKGISFRKLAKHPDLPMSPAALYRSVAIYELAERLSIDGERRVSTSHLRLLLPLRGDEQARLLRLAEANAWSVSRLELEIASSVKVVERRQRGGRKRRSRLRKAIEVLEKCIDESSRVLETEDEKLSQDTARSVVEKLRRLQLASSQLETRIRNGLDESCDWHDAQ